MKVFAFDDSGTGVLCRAASHKCPGIYHCEHILPQLLNGYERYEADDEDPDEDPFWELECKLNESEPKSLATRAAM